MPLNLLQGGTIAVDSAFRGRVAMAFYFVARQVIVEDEETPGHENRKRFALSTIFQDHTEFSMYAASVVTDPTIVAASPANAAAVSDAQIIAAVTAMWNTLSHVE